LRLFDKPHRTGCWLYGDTTRLHRHHS
jgi:hypothetical protein